MQTISLVRDLLMNRQYRVEIWAPDGRAGAAWKIKQRVRGLYSGARVAHRTHPLALRVQALTRMADGLAPSPSPPLRATGRARRATSQLLKRCCLRPATLRSRRWSWRCALPTTPQATRCVVGATPGRRVRLSSLPRSAHPNAAPGPRGWPPAHHRQTLGVAFADATNRRFGVCELPTTDSMANVEVGNGGRCHEGMMRSTSMRVPMLTGIGGLMPPPATCVRLSHPPHPPHYPPHPHPGTGAAARRSRVPLARRPRTGGAQKGPRGLGTLWCGHHGAAQRCGCDRGAASVKCVAIAALTLPCLPPTGFLLPAAAAFTTKSIEQDLGRLLSDDTPVASLCTLRCPAPAPVPRRVGSCARMLQRPARADGAGSRV